MKKLLLLLFSLSILSLSSTTFSGCKKSEHSKQASPTNTTNPTNPTNTAKSYTGTMGGMRHWHGHYYSNYDQAGNYDLPDTSFAINITDTVTISILGKTFTYSGSDSVNGIIFFNTASEYYTYQNGTGVAYFYSKDSIADVDGYADPHHNMYKDIVYHTY